MAVKRLAACIDRDPTGDPRLQLVLDEGKEFPCPTGLDFGREKELAIVPGATHLFEEPGALHEVADLASRWFSRHEFGEIGVDILMAAPWITRCGIICVPNALGPP
ncbi:hypothetical protein NKH19_22640 [Mesorhizobium sp. M1338]|uniref:hypothetical protein n=1 Tax=Mesorhizobium sp. M1338 TaxID=2957085 RepID=UPI003338E250